MRLSHIASIAFVRSFGVHHSPTSVRFLKHFLDNVKSSCIEQTDAIFGDCAECFKKQFSFDVSEIVKFNCSEIMSFLKESGIKLEASLFHETSSLACLKLFDMESIDEDELARSVQTQLKAGNVECLRFLMNYGASIPHDAISVYLRHASNVEMIDFEMIHFLLKHRSTFDMDTLFQIKAPLEIFKMALSKGKMFNLRNSVFLDKAIHSSCDDNVIEFFANHCQELDENSVLLAIDVNSSAYCVSLLIDRCQKNISIYWEHFLADETIDDDIGNLLCMLNCPLPKHVSFVCQRKKHWIANLTLNSEKN